MSVKFPGALQPGVCQDIPSVVGHKMLHLPPCLNVHPLSTDGATCEAAGFNGDKSRRKMGGRSGCSTGCSSSWIL